MRGVAVLFLHCSNLYITSLVMERFLTGFGYNYQESERYFQAG